MRKYTLYFNIIGILILEDQDVATSELERNLQWKPSMHSKFWPVEHPFLVSINNYIRSTLSIRNGHIKKELHFVGLIAHVLL